MDTIVDLDIGQVFGLVDGRDSTGVGTWLFKRPLDWRLGVQVVATGPSAAFRKALAVWLPRTGSPADAAAAKMQRGYVEAAGKLETNRLWRTLNKCRNEIEVLVVTGAASAKVEANTTIQNIRRAGRGYRNPWNFRSRVLLLRAVKTTA